LSSQSKFLDYFDFSFIVLVIFWLLSSFAQLPCIRQHRKVLRIQATGGDRDLYFANVWFLRLSHSANWFNIVQISIEIIENKWTAQF
jgi:hypothetical protein